MSPVWKLKRRSRADVVDIHKAAAAGNVDLLQKLIGEDEKSINAKDGDGKTPLHWAAINGHPVLVEALLDQHEARIDIQDCLGKPAMHYAVQRQDTAIAEAFLRKGSGCIGSRDRHGRTALHEVVDRGSDAMLGLLCSNPEFISLSDDCKRTPLHYAARSGNEGAVKTLLSHGARIDEERDVDGKTALHWAAFCAQTRTLEELLKRTADAAAKDRHGCTALHWAAAKGHYSAASLLLDRKELNHELQEKVLLLMANIAPAKVIDAETDHLGTLVGWAVLRDHQAVLRAMMEVIKKKSESARCGTQDKGWMTVMHLAVWHGTKSTVELLKEMGGSVDAKNRLGKTPLHVAAEDGKMTMVAYLVEEAGANLEARDDEGQTAIHSAASWGDRDGSVIRYLVEAGASVNAKDNNGWTAMHAAASRCNHVVISYLKEEVGMAVDIKDKHGKLPLELAIACNNATTPLDRVDIPAELY